MRLGIFGGTFDPPHVGHLLAASDAFEALALDRLLFVPAGVQPLKELSTMTPGGTRLAMVRALVGDDPRFAVDPMELERPGVSFTVDTLRELAGAYPGASLHFIAGSDVLDSFDRWREPGEVLRLAQLVLVRRPGAAPLDDEAVRVLVARGGGACTPVVLRTRAVEVSSTEIRARVARGLPIRGFVPDAVAALIASAGLYR